MAAAAIINTTTFNSLFEMQVFVPVPNLRDLSQAFNSLFEMQNQPARCGAARRHAAFNSLFEMRFDIRLRVRRDVHHLSILYLRCRHK